ncbi:hypothetical protein [Caballeronia arationis]|nr:hypothetical protein [Caballeronia arationis]
MTVVRLATEREIERLHACHRPQQAQERSEKAFDHRRVLDSGNVVVMS